MKINSIIVKIFGVLIVLMHLTVVAVLLFALYANADPDTASRILRSIDWMQLINPSFEVIIALIFLIYVVFVGTLSVLLNISHRHDESVEVLNEIRDLLRQKLHRWQVKYYWQIIFTWALILFSIDPLSLIYAWLVPAGFAKLFGSLVFTFSHRGKKANSDTWVGLLTLGEGFHDIHHKNVRVVLWHPLDIGGQLIRMIDRDVKI